MRIALLYPPPWKIPAPGEPTAPRGEGPPAEYREGDLDTDFYQIPHGLLSLAAQAIRAGHQVKVLNLSAFAWPTVERVIAALDADLYGLSCWTANRRGVALTAREIRRVRKGAPIVVGGPHASPLAREMLAHHPEIDAVCVGESEATFLELISRVAQGRDLRGTPGTVYRSQGRIQMGPSRALIPELDTLASPHDYFDTHVVMTARGCPWACTFCGADTTWGRGSRGHSVPYVLDMLERAASRLPVKMVQIKDDTFTTNKKRVLQICKGIRDRRINLAWSCDTRVDVLSDELLREMRLAGCQQLSLGVESGSPKILAQIDKKITVDKILEATELAKKYGIRVRFYMMLGNRGETEATFRETLAFLDKAAPHQYIFSCLSIYPGTRDFEDAEKAGFVDREQYFTEDFQELKTTFDATPEVTELLSNWFRENSGLRMMYREGVAEREQILGRLPDFHGAHLDLANALCEAGRFQEAEHHARRALELGHPLPGLARNTLAVIAKEMGNIDEMMNHYTLAAKTDPQHFATIKNVQTARAWFAASGPERSLPLKLSLQHDFQLLERTLQPTLPGPLGDDFATWPAKAAPPEPGGSQAPKGRLPVVG